MQVKQLIKSRLTGNHFFIIKHSSRQHNVNKNQVKVLALRKLNLLIPKRYRWLAAVARLAVNLEVENKIIEVFNVLM